MTGATPTGSGSQAAPGAASVSAVPVSIPSADWTKADRPSAHGARLGALLSDMVRAGGGAEMCATCAFREGSMPNMMAGTGLIAMHCALGTDPSPFGCHHGMKDGEPARLCAGAAAASNAPFETWKAAIAGLNTEPLSDEANDPIRADFDAWRAAFDPTGALDVYQLGRAFARRDASAIEARRAAALDAVHESAVPQADAQGLNP